MDHGSVPTEVKTLVSHQFPIQSFAKNNNRLAQLTSATPSCTISRSQFRSSSGLPGAELIPRDNEAWRSNVAPAGLETIQRMNLI